jgi:hypothetical protein
MNDQRIRDWLRRALGIARSTPVKSGTDALAEDTFATIEQVREGRKVIRRTLREKPDLARALLLARDGTGER